MLKLVLTFILAAGGLNQCHSNPPADAGPPAPAPAMGGSMTTGGAAATGGELGSGGAAATGGAPAPASSLDDCAAADAKLNQLGCPQAKTPKGKAFVDVCRAASATHQNMHPECIAKVTSCAAVPAAYRECK